MDNLKFIQVETDENIGIIQLNRPEVLNALNRKMVNEIVRTIEDMDRDEKVKVIVLCGNGKAFAAGADINEMAQDSAIDLELLNQFADWDLLLQVKKPMIGAVHGFALGGGFELALACDLLFAAEDAKFGFPEINLAVMPGAGGTQRLTKLMGKTKALEWLWSGEMMTASEAEQHGIINKRLPKELVIEETINYAKKLAEKPALSVRFIKEAVYKAVDDSLLEGMQYERKNFSLLFSTEDQKEGMKAFMEKRKPQFKGR
ncbi:enoyl-CoA hydratase-related protein [Heyndrickxia sporothermodurans]|uniref:Enoyl-CoA hydratase n=1 Tax=Heyndrickxia sporothermodurans TaxID=46224 RepID=A0A150LEL3_9BACI|nr:enoyl-CoA hydratase-related protein [Heyndrickxia sporothermodurans]KYD10459.1 Enoyl-CoA hydratase [Heyndrickxia sporothermodurans]MBL5767142.1 enoyl-CoA hydratase/isomerase family protein [Heyndrickxia sporothermodurans]MBL5770641.1 enoyl-CoA hydratase/isomerase family protein [Heyndrickxia sporothermodurans]MBL5775501.1 enoyl-CoA hydratase/isomerase family protein [Heyndrickxia sporothermodurans]MBL5778486.1 enoyl-CoA hydratase/isomerase family protein [Heyndrickxia sporothermodurans]